MTALSVESDGAQPYAITRELRALVLRGKHDDGSLLHLIERGAIATLCGAYPIEALVKAGGADERVCPACIEHLKGLWLRAEAATS